MAFPTSQRTLSRELDAAIDKAIRIRGVCVSSNATMAAGDVSAALVMETLDELKAAHARLQAAAARTGMGAHAQEQLGSDVTADFTAMISAIAAAATGIISAMPKDGSGYLLVRTMSAQGDRSDRQFTPAQTAGIRALLSAVIASIEG